MSGGWFVGVSAHRNLQAVNQFVALLEGSQILHNHDNQQGEFCILFDHLKQETGFGTIFTRVLNTQH